MELLGQAWNSQQAIETAQFRERGPSTLRSSQSIQLPSVRAQPVQLRNQSTPVARSLKAEFEAVHSEAVARTEGTWIIPYSAQVPYVPVEKVKQKAVEKFKEQQPPLNNDDRQMPMYAAAKHAAKIAKRFQTKKNYALVTNREVDRLRKVLNPYGDVTYAEPMEQEALEAMPQSYRNAWMYPALDFDDDRGQLIIEEVEERVDRLKMAATMAEAIEDNRSFAQWRDGQPAPFEGRSYSMTPDEKAIWNTVAEAKKQRIMIEPVSKAEQSALSKDTAKAVNLYLSQRSEDRPFMTEKMLNETDHQTVLQERQNNLEGVRTSTAAARAIEVANVPGGSAGAMLVDTAAQVLLGGQINKLVGGGDDNQVTKDLKAGASMAVSTGFVSGTRTAVTEVVDAFATETATAAAIPSGAVRTVANMSKTAVKMAPSAIAGAAAGQAMYTFVATRGLEEGEKPSKERRAAATGLSTATAIATQSAVDGALVAAVARQGVVQAIAAGMKSVGVAFGATGNLPLAAVSWGLSLGLSAISFFF